MHRRVARFELNQFSWTPILEVAALFIGIFLTMIPALNFLGQIADRLPLNRITVFIFTGGISGVLDNAPTYATFFEIASRFPGEPRVADVPEVLLTSVALGAVLGGALTYIGNGPNFMVKSVADAAGVETPSFGGYVVQSLTYLVPVFAAMALIFAVFLTNPAPICVLDEVDAPLDDHNVERFCNLMDEMAKTTETRFVIITHNPITMARMNRLFGVTMAERGVSQLMSVDLDRAVEILDQNVA